MTDASGFVDVPTPSGTARAHLYGPRDVPVLALGHGAGGGTAAVDVQAAAAGAQDAGLAVLLVEQPWRVAGRRVAEAPARLDAAWLSVLEQTVAGRPLVLGGRSAGARVACRTAATAGAGAVLALAFPLVPPTGSRRTRAPELLLPAVPVLVVQGSRDGFGVPADASGRTVHVVAGADHGFAVRRLDGRTSGQVAAEVRAVVAEWLTAAVLPTLRR